MDTTDDIRDLTVPDCLWPSDNVYEVPSLLAGRCPAAAEIPFVCFGEQRRTFRMHGHGTLHFYTEDYRYTQIYDKPEQVLGHEPKNIVEPNYSLFNETPVAFGLQNIYKKRFIARAMQERGIGVFVDLNVAPKWYKLNLLGVPRGWTAFCTRGYSDRVQMLDVELGIARMVADGREPLFVIYGGGEACKAFARANGCVYVTPIIAIKNKTKVYRALEEDIAFLRQPDKLDLFNAPYVRQAEDFAKSYNQKQITL